MKKIVTLLLVVGAAGFFYYKTGPEKEKAVVGRWQTTSSGTSGVYGTMLVVLGQNKTFHIKMTGTKAGQPVSLDVDGDWRVIANNLNLTVRKSSDPRLAVGTALGGRIVRLDEQQMVYKTATGEESLQRVRGVP